MIINGTMHTLPQRRQATGRSDDSSSCDNSNQPLQWAQQDGSPPPSDWLALQCAGEQGPGWAGLQLPGSMHAVRGCCE
jgi:hypothetical protein